MSISIRKPARGEGWFIDVEEESDGHEQSIAVTDAELRFLADLLDGFFEGKPGSYSSSTTDLGRS